VNRSSSRLVLLAAPLFIVSATSLVFAERGHYGHLWSGLSEVTPRIDGGAAAPALALVAGGLTVFRGRRRAGRIVAAVGPSGEMGHAMKSRCPICAGGWSRCRLCNVRQPFGETIVCPVAHREDPSPLYCRCGAVMGPGVVQMPAGTQVPVICDAAMPRTGLLGGLRALHTRRRLGMARSRRDANTRAAALRMSSN
jgi:hypothetical protein